MTENVWTTDEETGTQVFLSQGWQLKIWAFDTKNIDVTGPDGEEVDLEGDSISVRHEDAGHGWHSATPATAYIPLTILRELLEFAAKKGEKR